MVGTIILQILEYYFNSRCMKPWLKYTIYLLLISGFVLLILSNILYFYGNEGTTLTLLISTGCLSGTAIIYLVNYFINIKHKTVFQNIISFLKNLNSLKNDLSLKSSSIKGNKLFLSNSRLMKLLIIGIGSWVVYKFFIKNND